MTMTRSRSSGDDQHGPQGDRSRSGCALVAEESGPWPNRPTRASRTHRPSAGHRLVVVTNNGVPVRSPSSSSATTWLTTSRQSSAATPTTLSFEAGTRQHEHRGDRQLIPEMRAVLAIVAQHLAGWLPAGDSLRGSTAGQSGRGRPPAKNGNPDTGCLRGCSQ